MTTPVEEGFADLHIHTSCSDGVLSPPEVVQSARRQGLRAVGITDHDSVDGVESAVREGERFQVEVYAGVELSVRVGEYDVHLLGYFIDPMEPGLLECLDHFRETRSERARAIVARLNELGVGLGLSAVLTIAGSGSIGRMHVAKALVQEGHCPDVDAAFSRYLRDGGPAFVEKCRIAAGEATEIVHRAGGLAILAHPGFYDDEALIAHLFDVGMDGLEVYNPKHSQLQILRYQKIVRAYDGIESGGSDFHGGREGSVSLGHFKVPYSLVARMKAYHSVARRAVRSRDTIRRSR